MIDSELNNRLNIIASGVLVQDARAIIDSARSYAYRSVNAALVYRNWYLGKRIAEEVLKGEGRAEYGKSVISDLSAALSNTYGKGYEYCNLYSFLEFYRAYPIL